MKKRTKNKGRGGRGQLGLGAPPREVLERLSALAGTAPATEGLGELKLIARRYPRSAAVQSLLLNYCHDLGDMIGYQVACEALVELEPDASDLILALAETYLRNQHLALSVLTLRVAQERFPENEKVAGARETLERLESALPQFLESLSLEGDDAFELAVLHEEVQARMEAGDNRRSRAAAEELLARRPGYRAALNNLSQLDFIEGRFDEAVARTAGLLEREPGNIHGLSNLVRLQAVAGRLDLAREAALRFAEAESTTLDHRVAMAESFSILGDDQRVLEIFTVVEEKEDLEPRRGKSVALIYHYAAVAEARLGRDEQALALWKKALAVGFGRDLIQQNLDDLSLPAGERFGPWPLPLSNWVRPELYERAYRMLTSARRRGERASQKAIRRLLEEQAELRALIPVILDRGDPDGKLWAYAIARAAWTPETLAALRDFALGRRGPDGLRLEVVDALCLGGALPREPLMMWLEGEGRLVIPRGFEVRVEPADPPGPEVKEPLSRALAALGEGHLERAQALFHPLLRRREPLQVTEFVELCRTAAQIADAEDERGLTSAWLDLWSRTLPEDQGAERMRQRLLGGGRDASRGRRRRDGGRG